MQYGCLTAAQIEKFKTAQEYMVRYPSFVVWIEGFGTQNGTSDPTEYIIEIDVEVALESSLGAGYLNIGRAIILANNENGHFYSDGKSKIKKNAKIKIWSGFDNYNIPIFTGIINNVCPKGTKGLVVLNCKDYMGLFQEVLIEGNQNPNNTVKLLVESFCKLVNLPEPVMASTDETTRIYTEPMFDEQSLLEALEEVCNSIFYVAYFNEDGRLNAFEREFRRFTDFQFTDRNIIDCENLTDTEVINDISIEYEDNSFIKSWDQLSIDTYGRNSKSYKILLLESNVVSEKIFGSTLKSLNYELEAFKFLSQDNSAFIDSVSVKLKKENAQGNISIRLCADNNGIPGNVTFTSQPKTGDSLPNELSWVTFYFSNPVDILPQRDYWIIIDTSMVNRGDLYIQIKEEESLGNYAYYDGSWHLENNKEVSHKIKTSIQGIRLAEDMIGFYKWPYERIRITAPAVPQLQLMDEVFLNIKLREIYGRYVVEGRRHIISPNKYVTEDILRKVN